MSGEDDAGSPPPLPDAGDAGHTPSMDAGPDPGRSYRIVVLSDLNGSYGSTEYSSTVHAAVSRVIAMNPDLVLSTGDMVAGQMAGLDYEAMWDGFHAAVSDRLATAGIPFAVTPGNHDASAYSSFAMERSTFVAEWQVRRPDLEFVDDAHYPLRYAFRLGPALFVSLDDTTVGHLGSEQMSWLEDLLITHDAAVKIVYGHVPLYPFAVGRETEYIGDANLENMLNRHEVDLFLSGHHHAYYPGRRGSLRLVSMACQGSGPRALIGGDGSVSRSILLFEIDADGIHELDAYGGSGYDQPIARATLPPYVNEGELRIDRDDL